MVYTLPDGTTVEYRVLTTTAIAGAVVANTDDTKMFAAVIRLAVATPENVLERLAGSPDPVGQTALLGTDIILRSLNAALKTDVQNPRRWPALWNRR